MDVGPAPLYERIGGAAAVKATVSGRYGISWDISRLHNGKCAWRAKRRQWGKTVCQLMAEPEITLKRQLS